MVAAALGSSGSVPRRHPRVFATLPPREGACAPRRPPRGNGGRSSMAQQQQELLDPAAVTVKGLLGRGGFAVVYRGTYTAPGAQPMDVALKLLSVHESQRASEDAYLQMFLREARCTMRLEHRCARERPAGREHRKKAMMPRGRCPPPTYSPTCARGRRLAERGHAPCIQCTRCRRHCALHAEAARRKWAWGGGTRLLWTALRDTTQTPPPPVHHARVVAPPPQEPGALHGRLPAAAALPRRQQPGHDVVHGTGAG